jgi:hypothetical protein
VVENPNYALMEVMCLVQNANYNPMAHILETKKHLTSKDIIALWAKRIIARRCFERYIPEDFTLYEAFN